MRQTPWSASTKAPASNVHSLLIGFRRTYAVKPTAEAPWPVVNTALGAIFSTCFKNCDLAVPGSPQSNTFISPRIVCFSPAKHVWFFYSIWYLKWLKILLTSLLTMSESFLNFMKITSYFFFFLSSVAWMFSSHLPGFLASPPNNDKAKPLFMFLWP